MGGVGERAIGAAAWCFCEDDEQQQYGKRGDHQQQLIIVDVRDDLHLLRDHGVERGATDRGQGIPELRDRRTLEGAISPLRRAVRNSRQQ